MPIQAMIHRSNDIPVGLVLAKRATPSCPCLLSRLLVGFAGIFRRDHGWLDAEADPDLVHEYLDPAAQFFECSR